MNREFQDRLLAAEQMTPSYRERYEEEVKSMLEHRLNTAGRIAHVAIAAASAGLAVFWTTLALHAHGSPMLVRGALGVGALLALGVAVMMAWIARRGVYNRRSVGNLTSGLVWGFVTVIMTAFMVFSARQPDATKSVYLVLYGLVFLVFAAVQLILNRIDQLQLKTREELLEIKLKLAEMLDKGR